MTTTIEWPTRDNLPTKYEKAKAETVYCEACGKRLELRIRTDYKFDKITGEKKPYHTSHDWCCPMFYGWKPRYEWGDCEEQNPHTIVVLGGIMGGPAL